jgi:hypothetical protein
METVVANLVPKVHPATREVLPEDPMGLHATPVPGDPEVMIRAVVQEFAGMGWDIAAIVGLFRDPSYPLLHGLWLALGEAAVRERIASVVRRYGVYRFRATVHEEPEDTESGPELVQIGPLGPGESRHAHGH